MSSTRTTGTCRVHLSDIVFRMRRFAKLSASERKTKEMYHFVFHQSHISEKNMDRLRVLLDDPMKPAEYGLCLDPTPQFVPINGNGSNTSSKWIERLPKSSWMCFLPVSGLTWNTMTMTKDCRSKLPEAAIGQYR